MPEMCFVKTRPIIRPMLGLVQVQYAYTMFAYEKSEFILLDIWPFISVSESWRLLMSGKQCSTDQIHDVSEPIEVSNKCIAVRKVATPLYGNSHAT